MKDNHPVDAHFGSHAQADVVSMETPEFIFPVGDQGIYQPLKISEGNSEDLTVSYKHSMHSFNNTSISIDKMSTRFHWVAKGSKEARLTLSWNAFSELEALTEELAALVMLGYTGSVWEVIPATLSPFTLSGDVPTSLTEGAISSTERVDFSLYEAFTLGSILLDTSIKVSEAITPNGDGINDTWFIENIERYPAAQIRVFNRWGAEVFKSSWFIHQNIFQSKQLAGLLRGYTLANRGPMSRRFQSPYRSGMESRARLLE